MAHVIRILERCCAQIVFAGLLCAAIADSARFAFAEEPSEAQIIESLLPNAGLGMARSVNGPRGQEGRRLIEQLRARSARSVTMGERAKVAELSKDWPSIDIEINFDLNSADVGTKALKPLLTLGRALSDKRLAHSVFLINGHTDAKGGDQYNDRLSERRAEAVRRVLIEEFKLPSDALIAIGYGKTKLKNARNPYASENRRVQIVNTGQK